MNMTIWTALAASLALAGCGDGNQQSITTGSGTTGNISQSQSGWNNSQSISIGNADGDAKPGKGGSTGSVSITQKQSGVNRSQSLTVDGKKIETTN